MGRSPGLGELHPRPQCVRGERFMGVIWSTERSGRTVEVRNAGRTLRLYVDGVLHTQYNPKALVTDSVWDLLALPAFVVPGPLKRVLILGVGGGALVHLLRRLRAPRRMTGVELDPLHLQIARDYFGIEGPDLTLHCADARTWAERYRGKPFDYVVEDAFLERDGEPERAIAMDDAWARVLLRLTAPHGVLVTNFPCRRDLVTSAMGGPGLSTTAFPSAFMLRHPTCDNAVGVFCRTPTPVRSLRRRLHAADLPAPMMRRLRFEVQSLWAPNGTSAAAAG